MDNVCIRAGSVLSDLLRFIEFVHKVTISGRTHLEKALCPLLEEKPTERCLRILLWLKERDSEQSVVFHSIDTAPDLLLFQPILSEGHHEPFYIIQPLLRVDFLCVVGENGFPDWIFWSERVLWLAKEIRNHLYMAFVQPHHIFAYGMNDPLYISLVFHPFLGFVGFLEDSVIIWVLVTLEDDPKDLKKAHIQLNQIDRLLFHLILHPFSHVAGDLVLPKVILGPRSIEVFQLESGWFPELINWIISLGVSKIHQKRLGAPPRLTNFRESSGGRSFHITEKALFRRGENVGG